MDPHKYPQILPMPQIEIAKLHTIRKGLKKCDTYIFSQFTRSKIKDQFRQIKRIKGFEARENNFFDYIPNILPKVTILSHTIKENCIFKIPNLRYLTYFWRSFLGTSELSFITQVKNVKKVLEKSKTKPNNPHTGSIVEVSRHYSNFLPQIIQKLIQTRIVLASLSISYESKYIRHYDVNRDFKPILTINNYLKKLYSLQKLSIENISKGKIIQDDLETILTRNKNLKEISLIFSFNQRDVTLTYAQALQSLNPKMPLLEFLFSGQVQLKKISQDFQFTHMEVTTTESNHFELGSFNNLDQFQSLKYLCIFCCNLSKPDRANFEKLMTFFKMICNLPNLEYFEVEFTTYLKKDDDFPELGKFISQSKKLKSLSIQLIAENVGGFDTLSFIQNALTNNQTLENIQLDCHHFKGEQNYDFLPLNNITLEKGQFITLQKLTLDIYPAISDSQNLNNLRTFLKSLPNLVSLVLNLTNVQIEDGNLEVFSASFKALEKLNQLYLQIYNCFISNGQEIINLWDNINQIQSLKQLKFEIPRGKFGKADRILDKWLQYNNHNLYDLELHLSSEILDRPDKVVKACSQAYKNLKNLYIVSNNILVNLNSAYKIGQHLASLQNLQILKLDLGECQIRDLEFNELMEGIGSCSQLHYLDLELNENNIKLENISEFLPQCCLLEVLKLNLSRNLISKEAAFSFCHKINGLSQIRTIDLNFDRNELYLQLKQKLHEILYHIWEKNISCISGYY